MKGAESRHHRENFWSSLTIQGSEVGHLYEENDTSVLLGNNVYPYSRPPYETQSYFGNVQKVREPYVLPLWTQQHSGRVSTTQEPKHPPAYLGRFHSFPSPFLCSAVFIVIPQVLNGLTSVLRSSGCVLS